MKQKSTAWLLWLFLGVFGAYKFYTGNFISAITKLFTANCFFIGLLIDIFSINNDVDAANFRAIQQARMMKGVME
ncbi:NINE protein [Bacillus thuringiensis]|uniref:NINE protein n=1 Tax=Bacillus thuringiensis TaxID=1428 RepID=UPI00234E885C|nr:NINE protein [Bacillus thuringiensis]MDC7733008.1 NINE protein [Bacillus thuringiensis]HDR8193835.1 NINE protein [Bacillus thuringiensis]